MTRRRGAVPALALAVALAATVVLLVLVARASASAPFQDEYQFTLLYSALSRGHWPDFPVLLAAHNGHPYLLLNSLVSATILWGLPWNWLQFAQPLLLLATVCLLLVQSEPKAGRAATLPYLVAAAFAVLTARQWENLYWSMQVVFPLFLFASVASFAAAHRYSLSRSTGALAAAMGFGLLASLCNGAGIITLFLTTAALLILRLPPRQVLAVLALAAFGTLLFYLAQLLSVSHAVARLRPSLDNVVRYEGSLLMHAFAAVPQSSRGWWAGASLVLAVVACCGLAGLRRWRDNLFGLLLLALGLAVSMAVTHARLKTGVWQPDAPRYLPLLLPVVLGCLAIAYNQGWRIALLAGAAFLAWVWWAGVSAEWPISPYRKDNVLAERRELCLRGTTPSTIRPVRGDALVNVQRLFCGGSESFYEWRRAAGAASVKEVAYSSEGRGASPSAFEFRASRGASVLYRSGPAAKHQTIEVAGSRVRRVALPASAGWVRIEFNSPALPQGEFVVRIRDQGGEPGDWSALALTASAE